MFKTLSDKIPKDADLPERAHTIEVLNRVLDGELYDVLPHPFHMEKNDAGEYVLLRDRRPSVMTGIIKTVVDDTVSMLFSEGHFPEVYTEDETLREQMAALIKQCNLNLTMIEAATFGSVGSVVIWLRVLKGKPYFEALRTTYLTPVYYSDEPDRLQMVVERRKVKGSQLREAGYTGVEDAATYWFEREWTETEEVWYQPREVAKVKNDPEHNKRVKDTTRSVTHGLGFVPMVWIKNLPGGKGVDGAPTMTREAINTVIEADYQLSQVGRGLKYSQDPTLILKEPAVDAEGRIVKAPGNALQVGEGGDAKLLEINGSAAKVVLEYVHALRDVALESMHGNRSNPDKMSAAQSGRALELMHQALIWLADKLRISYGEGALLQLLNMVIKASQKLEIIVDDKKLKGIKAEKLTLVWPAWFPPTHEDKMNQATALSTLTTAKVISTETATKAIAADYDIEDVKSERERVDQETEKGTEQQIKLAQAKPQPAPMGKQ